MFIDTAGVRPALIVGMRAREVGTGELGWVGQPTHRRCLCCRRELRVELVAVSHQVDLNLWDKVWRHCCGSQFKQDGYCLFILLAEAWWCLGQPSDSARLVSDENGWDGWKLGTCY